MHVQVTVKVTMPTSLGTDTVFHQQEAKVDVWDAGPDQFAQEPIFCPRTGASDEDDGWVFTMVYDTLRDRSHLAILNAQDLKAGPVARIKLPHQIPFGVRLPATPLYVGLPACLSVWVSICFSVVCLFICLPPIQAHTCPKPHTFCMFKPAL